MASDGAKAKPTRRQTITDFVKSSADAVGPALLLLEQVGAAGNFPILQGIAGVTRAILEICNSATANKEECKELGRDVQALLLAVAGGVEAEKENLTHDQDFLEQIGALQNRLNEVQDTLRELHARGRSIWYTSHSADEITLQRLRRDIRHAFDVFKLFTSLRNNRVLSRANEIAASQRREIFHRIEDITKQHRMYIKTAFAPVDTASPRSPIRTGPVLPPPVTNFFGRETEIETLVANLSSPDVGRIAILGPGGIGKTSLASKILHDNRIEEVFGSRRYFVSCEVAKTTKELVTALANALGVQGEHLQRQILRYFTDLEQPTILVLDNVEATWEVVEAKPEVEKLLSALANIKSLSLVITMRGSERPKQVAWSRPFFPSLMPLDQGAARQAFLAWSNCDSEDPNINELIALVDHVPLAVTLMGALAQTDSTDTLLRRWKEEKSALLHSAPDRKSSVDISIQVSLNSPRMKAVSEALQLLALISLLPDGLENKELLAIVPSMKKSKAALSTLWQTALAFNDKQRTRVLSPIRAYMLSNEKPQIQYLMSLITYYLGLAGLTSDLGTLHGQSIVERLIPELGNLHSVIDVAFTSEDLQLDEQFQRGAIKGAVNLSRLHRYTSLGNPDTMHHALMVARRINDKSLCAETYFNWAHYNTIDSGINHAERLELCQSALTLYEEIGDKSGQAECTWLLGKLSIHTESRSKSIGLLNKARELAMESRNQYCQARCLASLSEVLFHEGELEVAEQQAQNALVIFTQLDNLPNIGTTFFHLGRIEFSRGRFDLAQTYYEQGVDPAEKAGLHKMVASLIIGKGDVLLGRCKYEAARHEFRRAGDYLKTRGVPKNHVNLYIDISIAETAIPLGELEEGRKHNIAALQFAQKLGWTHGIHFSKMLMGDVAFASEPRQLSEARKMYVEGLNGFVKAGYVEEQGKCCVRLGVLEASQGRVDDSLRFYVMALARFRKISNAQYLAKLFICMGDLFLTQGDAHTASVLYRAALPVSQRHDSVQDVADALLGVGVTGNPKVRSRLITEARSLLEQIGNTRGVEKCRAMLAKVDM